MKVSIVLATFNGEKYIRQQLQSICDQTIKPFEIIVSDDNSSDGTLTIVAEVLTKNAINYVIYKNTKQLGWRVNFRNSVLKASGDFIFFCDQDDYWFPNKIETYLDVFQNNGNIGVVSSGNTIAYDYTFLEKPVKCIDKLPRIKKEPFNMHFYANDRPGCTMAFRAKYKALFESVYWNPAFAHDEFLWITSKLLGEAYSIKCSSMYYIRHNDSATIKKDHTKETRTRYVNSLLNVCSLIRTLDSDMLHGTNGRLINGAEAFLQRRLNYLQNKKAADWFYLLFHCHYYQNLKAFVRDMLTR